MKEDRKQAFTLMELIVVIIIIGVLAGIMFPQYARSKERTIDKQAQAILSLIRAAERTYYMETGHYYPTGDAVTTISAINEDLNLDLVDDGVWNSYCITNADDFTATMSRNGGGYNRAWQITADDFNASCISGNQCP